MHTVELRNTLPLCSGGRQRVDLCESVSPQPGAAPGHMHRGKPRRVLEDDDDPSSDEMPGADSFEPSDASVDEFDPPPELAEWARQLLKRLTGTLGAGRRDRPSTTPTRRRFRKSRPCWATWRRRTMLPRKRPSPGCKTKVRHQGRSLPCRSSVAAGPGRPAYANSRT